MLILLSYARFSLVLWGSIGVLMTDTLPVLLSNFGMPDFKVLEGCCFAKVVFKTD